MSHVIEDGEKPFPIHFPFRPVLRDDLLTQYFTHLTSDSLTTREYIRQRKKISVFLNDTIWIQSEQLRNHLTMRNLFFCVWDMCYTFKQFLFWQ